MMGKTKRYTVLFDGGCGACRAAARWIEERDRLGRFELLPFQDPAVRRRFPDLRTAALEHELHVVGPDGAVRTGADAVPWVFDNLPGWSWVARILGLPGIRAVARPVYALFARYRPRVRASDGDGCTSTCRDPRRP